MEYVQMTLNDWLEIKQKLRQELLGVKQSFVRIGYMLRQIEDQKGYEQDGYKSIAEFAQKELGLHPSTTTRFIEINREYSIDGYSERLRPEYLDLGRSQLEEMLKLPDEDRTMIRPETSREDIRELKRFNKSEPAEGEADNMQQLIEKFYHDNPETLNELFSLKEGLMSPEFIKKAKELINPSGNRSYKKGMYFLMFYETKIVVKKFGATPQEKTWEEFLQLTVDIFGPVAAGSGTWKAYFGGIEEIEEVENNSTGTNVEESIEAKQPDERGSEENHEEISDVGKEEEKTENEGSQNGRIDTERTEPKTEEKEQKREIAPAQKSEEVLVNTRRNEESEPEIMKEPEVVDKPFRTRKQYIDSLTEYGAATYLKDEHRSGRIYSSIMMNVNALEEWLKAPVDSKGRGIE